jgi:APA family basic amino acid/polyamine antiporter
MQTRSKLSRFDFTMIMITLVIGMGIFRTPVNVAAASPSPFLFFAAWVAGGLVAICGALTYAEIGSRYPVTGGYYKIFSYAYHPSIAFAVNCIILISNAAGVAGVGIIGAEYIIKVLMPEAKDPETAQIIIAIVSIVIFYGINLAGLKMSARTQNVLAVIKISMIILLITPLFFATHNNEQTQISTIQTTSPAMLEYIKAFGICLVAVSFAYGGYQQSINFGPEVINPSKNTPRGIITGIIVIIVLYLLINYAYVKIIGFNQLKEAKGIAALMAGHVFGGQAGNILSVLLFLSVLAFVNVELMTNPRVMQAMSEDKVLPSVFQKRKESTDVLVASLSFFSALCVLIVFWAKTFDEILSFSIFLDCFGMALSAATIFRLRKRTAHLDHTGIFKMKLFPLVPILFISAYTFIAISIFFDKPYTALTGIGILFAFILLYFIIKPSNKS